VLVCAEEESDYSAFQIRWGDLAQLAKRKFFREIGIPTECCTPKRALEYHEELGCNSELLIFEEHSFGLAEP
jgi:hypothetical protein